MSINVSIAWIVTVILVSIRLAVLLFATPMDAVGRLPGTVRILFTLVAAVLLVNLLKLGSVATLPTSILSLSFLALGEVAIGLSLVLGMHAAMGSFMLAGKIMDSQSGFGAAGIFNPETQSQDPLFGTVLTFVGIVAFFSLGFHYYFIKGIVYSLEMLPPGSGFRIYSGALVLKQFSAMFAYGVMMSAPVVFVLLFIDVGVGVMARTMPQMNVYFSILPVKIFVALCVFALSLKYMQPLIEHIFADTFEYWHASINQMAKP